MTSRFTINGFTSWCGFFLNCKVDYYQVVVYTSMYIVNTAMGYAIVTNEVSWAKLISTALEYLQWEYRVQCRQFLCSENPTWWEYGSSLSKGSLGNVLIYINPRCFFLLWCYSCCSSEFQHVQCPSLDMQIDLKHKPTVHSSAQHHLSPQPAANPSALWCWWRERLCFAKLFWYFWCCCCFIFLSTNCLQCCYSWFVENAVEENCYNDRKPLGNGSCFSFPRGIIRYI